MSHTNSKAIRRLRKEHVKLKKYSLPNAEAHPTKDMLQWIAKIKGPEESLYADTIFNVKLTFSERYPMQAPKIQFETAIDHPAVEMSDGTVCSEVIGTDWSPTLNIFYILETLVGLLATRYSFQMLRQKGYYRALFMIKTFLGGCNLLTDDIPPLVLHVVVNFYFQRPRNYTVDCSQNMFSNTNRNRLETLDQTSFYEHVRTCSRKLTESQIVKTMKKRILTCNINGKRIMKALEKDNIEEFLRNELKCKNVLFAMYISDQIRDQKRKEFAFESYSVKDLLYYLENASCRFAADMLKVYEYDSKIYSQKKDQEIITFFSRHCGYTERAARALMIFIDSHL